MTRTKLCIAQAFAVQRLRSLDGLMAIGVSLQSQPRQFRIGFFCNGLCEYLACDGCAISLASGRLFRDGEAMYMHRHCESSTISQIKDLVDSTGNDRDRIMAVVPLDWGGSAIVVGSQIGWLAMMRQNSVRAFTASETQIVGAMWRSCADLLVEPVQKAEPDPVPHMNLPGRPREVLVHLLQGLSEKEVAARMQISADTVHVHVKRIYRVLGVNNRSSLVARCLRPSMQIPRDLCTRIDLNEMTAPASDGYEAAQVAPPEIVPLSLAHQPMSASRLCS